MRAHSTHVEAAKGSTPGSKTAWKQDAAELGPLPATPRLLLQLLRLRVIQQAQQIIRAWGGYPSIAVVLGRGRVSISHAPSRAQPPPSPTHARNKIDFALQVTFGRSGNESQNARQLNSRQTFQPLPEDLHSSFAHVSNPEEPSDRLVSSWARWGPSPPLPPSDRHAMAEGLLAAVRSGALHVLERVLESERCRDEINRCVGPCSLHRVFLKFSGAANRRAGSGP